MSQKSQKVFSRSSQPKEPTEQELKREIFANLPLAVFNGFTNAHSLMIDKYRQQKDGKSPPTIYVNKETEKFHKNLSKTDVNDELLKNLEFTGTKSDENSAKIWLLSKRDQNRIYAQSTKEQKKFLYLPKNVLLHATNFDDLMRAAAVEGRVPQPGKFVDDIFKNLHKIDKWIPELSNLKFLENPKAPPNDGMDVDSKPNRRSDANKSVTPLGSQKRKNRVVSIDDDKMSEQSGASTMPAKRRRSVRLQSKESCNDENDEHPATIVKIKKESKIPLIDKKRKSKAREIVFLGPTEFQSKVQKLNVEDFVTKTNIKAIILEEYRNDVGDKNASVPDDELTRRVMAYNSKRRDHRQWNRTGLIKLEFIDENESNQNSIAPQEIAPAIASTSAASNSNDKISNISQLNITDNSHLNRSDKLIEPNDFQKEIMSLNYETFINETNVKELVRKKFEKSETEPLIDDAAMETELKKLNEQRYHFKRYHKGLLNHLKFLKCECRRNKTFDDKWTQTDMVRSQDAVSQSNLIEGSRNEITESTQDDQSHASCQSKLSMLTVHEITESEIIQIESISSTFVANPVATTEPHAAHPSNESPLSRAISTEFNTPDSNIEFSNDIEDILASFEADYHVKDRVVDEQAETEFPETVIDEPIQPDSSAGDIIMVQKPDLPDESEIIPQSEVVDYMVECEVTTENIPGQYDATEKSTATDALVNEASFVDPETPIESSTDENQLNPTQPAGISGEQESVTNIETPCNQMSANGDAETSIEQKSIDNSDAQEQSLATSAENVSSFQLNSFEPKENSTPKPMNEVKHEEELQKTPCRKSTKNEDSQKVTRAVQNRPENPLKKINMVTKFFDAIRNKDPVALNRFREFIFEQ